MKPKLFFVSLLAFVFLLNTAYAQQKQFKDLIVTTTNGWHHESLHYGVVALEEMATRNFFDAVLFQDPNSFTDSFLKQFQVIIFLNTTGDIFNVEQHKVIELFI